MEAYLDNSATTRCCDGATNLMVELLTMDYGNPSSLHMKGIIAEKYITEAKKKIAKVLNLPENYVIHIALAIGKPAQNVIVEDINEGDDIKYWMDQDKTHHVPKIILDELIID